MAYTKTGPFADYSGTPGVSAGFLNNVETSLTALNVLRVAPAPSGDTTGVTDQAALQPIITAAQASGGIVILQGGDYYITGLTTSASFTQPIIRGSGMRLTTVHVVGTNAIGFTFTGGSGAESGGILGDMTLTSPSTGATGVRLAGVNGVLVERVKFTTIATGGEFANIASTNFTEFCVFESCSFETDCTTHLKYTVTNGIRSFHGSGFRNSIFNQASGDTTAKIVIGSGALVYQAPFDGTFFIRTTTALVQVSSTQHQNTYGNINIESGNSATQKLFASFDTTAMDWYHRGGVELLTQNVSMGGTQFRLVHRIQINDDGSFTPHYVPVEDTYTLGTGATDLSHLVGGASGFYAVTITASNYEHNFLLYVWRDGGDNNGVVTQLAHPRSFDTAGYGAPTFDVNSSTANLRITNASYPSTGVTAAVAYTPMNGRQSFRILS